MRGALLAAAGALMVAMAGCAVVGPQPGPEPAEPPEAVPDVEPPPPSVVVPREIEPVRPSAQVVELERLLDYFRALRRLNATELGREHENARAAFTRTRSDYDRVRLALLLSLPNTPFNDEGRVLELLEPMLRTPGSMLQGLAMLVHMMVHEQRRLEQNMAKLQEKLDALKSLERKLLEREKPGQTRR